ncbi:MAG: hypothetical protein AAFV77_00960 [Planctomycetota bacterium]
MSVGRLVSVLAMMITCAVVGLGCAPHPKSHWTDGLWAKESPDYPFVPNRVVIHPLTRASTDRDSRWRLRVHFFFVDAWNDEVKGLGRVQVQLFANGQWEGRRIEPVAWEEINLNDLASNRRHYDPVTRTYVLEVPESAMPEWLQRSLAELESKKDQPDEAYRTFAGELTLRVVHELTTGERETMVASNDFVLAPG